MGKTSVCVMAWQVSFLCQGIQFVYLLIAQSINCCKNQKCFNQFTMSLLFCVILFYMIFLVTAAALRFATVGAKVDER